MPKCATVPSKCVTGGQGWTLAGIKLQRTLEPLAVEEAVFVREASLGRMQYGIQNVPAGEPATVTSPSGAAVRGVMVLVSSLKRLTK